MNRLQATAYVLATWARDRRTPYLPHEQLEERRDQRVRDIVAYAAATVPHYRELFAREGIDPREIRGADDLERLPLLEKRDLLEDPERFRSGSQAGSTAVAYWTAGSTGRPLTVYHDRLSLLGNMAWSERERVVEARFCGKRVRYRRVVVAWTISTGAQTQAFYRRSAFAPLRPLQFSLTVEDPIEQNIAAVDRLRPDSLVGYGPYLETLFRIVAARNLSFYRPKVVAYVSVAMSVEGRRFIEETFGIPVISAYNAVEAFKIGFSCEERTGFHVHEDLCVVRLVDSDGRAVPNGATGEVVLSNLVNRGTVLLNYRLGDLAARAPGRCPCGRTLRLLADVEGRTADFVERDDGRLIYSSDVVKVVTQTESVLTFQLVQHEQARFELKVETISQDAFERVKGELVGRLKELLGTSVQIDITRHDRIEVGPRGKLRQVVSLFEPAQAR